MSSYRTLGEKETSTTIGLFSSYYIILYDKNTGHTFPHEVFLHPDMQSIKRLSKKLYSNVDEFEYFVTFTFANKIYYNKLHRWYYDENYRLTNNSNPKGVGFYTKYKVEFPAPLSEYLDSGFVNFIRSYFNNVQSALRRANHPTMTYVWKYEEGGKNSRPHFHGLITLSEVSWYPQAVSTFLGALLTHYWPYGIMEITPIKDRNMALAYLKKYFSKTTELKYWKAKRRWSTSREIKTPKGKGQYGVVYDGQFEPVQFQLYIEALEYCELYPVVDEDGNII